MNQLRDPLRWAQTITQEYIEKYGADFSDVDKLDEMIANALKIVRCEDCGMLYEDFPLDVIVPNDQWQAITGYTDGKGILCAMCIVRRGEKLPGVTVAKLVFE